MIAENGAVVRASDLVLGVTEHPGTRAYSGSVTVQSGATLELGALGGVAPGTLQIEPGYTLSGSGFVSAGQIVNDGLILAEPGLVLYAPVTGTGVLQIGAGGALELAADTAAIEFLGSTVFHRRAAGCRDVEHGGGLHHGDTVTFFGFVAGISTLPWTALDGTPGYQGATIHSELAGAGTGVNGSVTFAGVSLADALGRFTTTTGIVGGTSYLRIVFDH